MKNLLSFLLVLTSVLTANSQSLQHAWSYRWGSMDFDFPPGIAVDEHANVYLAGFFQGTVDFDPGPGNAILTSGASGFGKDTYISKFDSTGNFLWVKRLTSNSIHQALDIDYHSSGYLYITGSFIGPADFDPGPGISNLTTEANSEDMYILKLDHNGSFVWAVSTQGDGDKYPGAMALDDQGNIVTGGFFIGTCDFDPGSNQDLSTSIPNELRMYLAKYDTQGKLIWAKPFEGEYEADLNGIDVDASGNVYSAGLLAGLRDFDPGPDSVIIQSTGYFDAFVVKLDGSGNYQWVRHLGNDGEIIAGEVKVNDEGIVHVTGHFENAVDFRPGPESHILTATLTDPFVWKLDTYGELIWVAQFEGISFDRGRALSLDHFGNVYTTGYFAETMDFDPGPGEYNLTSTGNNDTDDAYVSKLTADGKFGWAQSIGSMQDDADGHIQLDAWGNLYITGRFQGTGGFFPDGSGNTDSLISAGSFDTFITRWRQCLETYEEISPAVCSPFLSPSGNYTWTESGIYLDTIENVAGCDSIITIVLTIIQQDLNVIQQGNQVTVDGEAEIYSWIDCDNGFTVIASGPVFTPISNGNYAVVGVTFGCGDTSACFSFIMTGTQESERELEVKIYPNPTHGHFFVDIPQPVLNTFIRIVDATGRIVIYQAYRNVELHEIKTELNPGVYFIEVQQDHRRQWHKLVVE